MENEIDAAIDWWVNCLKKYQTYDTGDVETDLLAKHTFVGLGLAPLTEEQLFCFATTLREDLLNKVAQEGPKDILLSVDYEPGEILEQASKVAQIDYADMRFPVKTSMWISPGVVEVSKGYGASFISIYQKD